MKTIFGMIGDFYHPRENAIDAVKKAVELNGAILIEGGTSEVGSALDTNPDALIIYRENRVNPEAETVDMWLTDEIDEKITTYVKNGGRIIAMHTAIASYPEDSKYIDMVKGYFVEHPVPHYMTRYVSSDLSPLGDKFDFAVMDEHYVVNVDEANTNVFMRHSSEYGESCSAWYHSYGNGKVMVLVPTHRKEGFENPEMQRLVNEAVAWVLKG